MKTIDATYDGKHVILDEPISAPPNTRVRVSFPDASPAFVKNLTVDDIVGCAHYDGPPKSLADYEDAIRQGAEESSKWSQ